MKIGLKYVACFGILVSLGLLFTPSSASALAVNDTCMPVEGIFARGSGQSLGDPEKSRFINQLRLRIPEAQIPVHEYELGKETYDGVKYAAVNVADLSNGNALGAAFSAGFAFDYGNSVNGGIKELRKYLIDRVAKCPDVRIVVGGYSQGAQVVRTAMYGLPSNVSSHIDFVALFGDPKLALPEGVGPIPVACFGLGYSSWRRDVPNCHTYAGSLGAQLPYVLDDMKNKTGLWCNTHDFVCGSSHILDNDGHNHYKDEGKAIDNAAIEAAKRLKLSLPPLLANHVDTKYHLKTGSGGLDTVFVIDTTGSMTNRINQAKEFARQSAAKVKENNGRVALVAYRDRGDSYTAQIMSGLQSDQTDFLAKLDGLQADGGGDLPEALLHALTTAFNGLSWKNGATKAAVVLTDAGFHNPDRVDGSTVNSVVKRSLEIDPVNVYPVVPGFLTTDYQDLASRTTGQVIEDSGDTVGALTTALTKIINRPVALLKNTEYKAPSGQAIHFDASDSYVIDAVITGYDWDFNGDGIYDQHTADPVVDYAYPGDFDGTMQVRVSADNNTIASASAIVKVGAPAEASKPVLPAMPNNFKVTVSGTTATTATLSWNQSDGKADKWVIAVNDVPAGTVEKTRTSVQVTGLNRSTDITFAIAGVTAAGVVGDYAIVTLPKTPVSPCGTSNSIADQYCQWSWAIQQQYLQWQQSIIQQYNAILRPY